MNIDVDKFLAMTALMAAAAAGQACTTSDGASPDDDTASGGSGGSGANGGTASSGGAGGSTGGTGGGAGAGPGEGGAGGAECLGDPVFEGSCLSLPYYGNDACGTPLGQSMCEYAELNYRSGVFQAVHECLSNLSSTANDEPCGETHTSEATACGALAQGLEDDVCPTAAAATYCEAITCDELQAGECEVWFSLLPDSTAEGSSAETAYACYAAAETSNGANFVGCRAALLGCIAGPTAE